MRVSLGEAVGHREIILMRHTASPSALPPLPPTVAAIVCETHPATTHAGGTTKLGVSGGGRPRVLSYTDAETQSRDASGNGAALKMTR